MKQQDDYPPEEVERRAQELARRVMSTPYQKQEWPKAKGDAEPPKRKAPAKSVS